MANAQGTMLLKQIRKLATTQCPSQQSDVELLQQFLAERDDRAFAAIVRRHGGMVLAVCRGVLRHQQDAEDAFQAAFLVLARKADAIRKHQSLSSWLHGVAYRLALKARAQSSRRRVREEPMEDVPAATSVDDLTLRELRVILHEELHRLPEKYRAPLLLCYWEGKTRDEAADQLGVTAGAFKKCLERARNLLGSRLTGRGLVPSAALIAALFSADGVRAAVSSVLTQSTAQAAVAFAAGSASSAGASVAALALAEGAIRVMQITKWAVTILTTIIIGGLGTVLSLAAYSALPGRQPEASGASTAPAGLHPVLLQAKDPPGQKADKDRIVGVWRIKSGRGNGEDLPSDATTIMRLHFTKEGEMIMWIIDEAQKGKYDLVGPGKIDLFMDAKENSPGIYKFDGDDQLTFCAPSNPGAKRPTEYSGEKDSGAIVFVLQRAKPGEEKLTPEQLAKLKDPVNKVREAAARAVSVNNLKQIAIAMHTFHDTNGALPAHAIYDKDGKKPLLSWRVAILPHLDQGALYNEFKLDEPWDSAHNKKLIAKMPKIYEPLGDGKKGDGLTYYQVFSGPDTVFDGPTKMKFVGITDGTSNTLLAIEAKESVVWTKPDDLKLPKDKDKLPPLGGLFKNGFNLLYCDGSVRFVSRDIPVATLRAIITPAGGEVIDMEKDNKD